jgi:hypothetical protein
MKISKPIPYIPKAQEKAQGRAEFIKTIFVPLSESRPVLDPLYVVKTWLDRGASSVMYGKTTWAKPLWPLILPCRFPLTRHGISVCKGQRPKITEVKLHQSRRGYAGILFSVCWLCFFRAI